jgi:hypothetical protein
VRCVSTGAERREGGLCADPACVVTPQARQDTAAEASCRAHARRLSGKQAVLRALTSSGLISCRFSEKDEHFYQVALLEGPLLGDCSQSWPRWGMQLRRCGYPGCCPAWRDSFFTLSSIPTFLARKKTLTKSLCAEAIPEESRLLEHATLQCTVLSTKTSCASSAN